MEVSLLSPFFDFGQIVMVSVYGLGTCYTLKMYCDAAILRPVAYAWWKYERWFDAGEANFDAVTVSDDEIRRSRNYRCHGTTLVPWMGTLLSGSFHAIPTRHSYLTAGTLSGLVLDKPALSSTLWVTK
ncbi:hypothetical protein [Arthrobacter sp. MYb227]|uniref:hypothetical protein n=1 Tax=Arthrobacter sp. MYb227 TaxID=1848601 RepID=UPI0011B03B59|nr:hypothetical protein [Arthrobacter sp. MYb227]